MTIASGTATTAELVALSAAAHKLVIALKQVKHGFGRGGNPAFIGRFTSAEADALVTAVTNAISAVNS